MTMSISGFSQKTLNSYSAPQTVVDKNSITLLPGFHANSNDGSYNGNNSKFVAKIGNPDTETIPPSSNIGNADASLTENYIYTREYLVPTTTSNAYAPQLQSITYFDGLNRPKQKIAIKATVSGNDIVSKIEYDEFGRLDKDFLPLPQQGSTNGELYSSVSESATSSLYGAGPYYSKKEFDDSPFDKLESLIPPGEWNTNNKKINYDYELNTENDVLRFVTNTPIPFIDEIGHSTLSLTANNYYPANTLYKNKVTDENGKITYEFVNGKGITLLTRKMLNDEPIDTYYIYNEFEQLAFVLSPLASAEITKNRGTDLSNDGNILSELSYQYRYDKKNRLVEKKLPGKGWEYLVYDNQDRLVASQDALQREKGGFFTFMQYDKFGRLAVQGQHPEPGVSRKNLQDHVNGLGMNNVERTTSSYNHSGIDIYYTSAYGGDNTNSIFTTINYYDNYNNLNVTPSSLLGQTVVGANETKTIGLTVATLTNILDTKKWNSSFVFYDTEFLRPVASKLNNYMNGQQLVASKFNYRGKVLNTITKHKLDDGTSPEVTVKQTFDYYNNQLLKSQTHQVNNGPVEYIAQNFYNEINQLTSKKVGNDDSSNPLQTVDYKYNIRGWMTDINNVDANESGAYKDLFAFKINYNKVDISSPKIDNSFVQPNFNGNISQIKWKTFPNNEIREYLYKFDDLNRLTNSNSYNHDSDVVGAYNENMWYDKNGNIIGLERYGGEENQNVKLIDLLAYQYQPNSNKLLNLTDWAYPGVKADLSQGFVDGNIYNVINTNDVKNDYAYDVNGNLIKDLNKQITKISYNYLNLPTEIIWNVSRKINYTYDANGAKLRKIVTNGTNITTIDYVDGFQYKKEGSSTPTELQFFPTAEGYVNVTNNNAFNYIYNYTDHLGNVRLSYQKETNGALTILEENNYYPFGLKHSGYDGGKLGNQNYNYKYNGKELQKDLDINLYDYGARNYDPAIGRWFNIDPMAPKYFSHSPYTYTLNNPVYFIDPDGMQSIRNNQNGAFNSPDSDDLYGTVSGITVYGSSGFDISELLFLLNSNRNNRHSFTNTAVRSYQNMMSTKNGRTYYDNLHNSKISKQADIVAVSYMAIIALPVAIEYGTVYASSEAGGAMISKIIESKVGQYIGRVGLDLAIKGAFNGGKYELNDITSSLVGGLIPGYFSGAASEITDLSTQALMGKDIDMDDVTASTIKAFIIPPIGGIHGAISKHVFKSSGVTSSIVEGVYNQKAGDAIDSQIEQYRSYKNSQ